MIIGVSGSVGSGKTTFATKLAKRLNCELINLNEWAKKFKLEEVDDLQTFDFDIDDLLQEIEKYILDNDEKTIVIESHFSHLISPEFIDILFILSRDLNLLKQEYENRDYNEQKIQDNLEVEALNVCFYEAEEEGYLAEQLILLENNKSIDLIIEKAIKKIESFSF